MLKRYIGCEVGNYDTKLMAEDIIEKPIAVLNIISPGHVRRTHNMGIGSKEKSLVNLLDVKITSKKNNMDKEHWFVGGLAQAEGRRKIKPSKKDKKSKNEQTIVQMLTTIAYYLYLCDTTNTVRKEVVELSTLLPTEEFFPIENDENDYEKILLDKLVSEHTVEFKDPRFNNAKITFEIIDPMVNPEGAAGQLACTYDFKGNELEDSSLITMQIDIGSIDTNISVLENGEFIEKGFFGLKAGTNYVLSDIANEIESIYGHKFDIHSLDYKLRNNKRILVGSEDITEFATKEADRRYKLAASMLTREMDDQLEERGINKEEIGKVNITGGGSLRFKPTLEEEFKSKYMRMEMPSCARFKNVEGALKALILRRLAEELESDEVFEDK